MERPHQLLITGKASLAIESKMKHRGEKSFWGECGRCFPGTKSCRTPREQWTAAHQAPLFSTVSQSLLKFTSTESVLLSNHLILCCPLLLPSIFPSIRALQRVSSSHQVTKILSPSYEYSQLISFKMDWFDLPEAQGTLKSLLQHHSSKA